MLDIFNQQLEHTVDIHIRHAAAMRGDEHIGSIPEDIIFGQGLRVRDVQCSTADLVAMQSRHKRLLVDDLAPRYIGNVGAARV